MKEKPNAQYNIATPGSLAERVGGHIRRQIFTLLMNRFAPTAEHTFLDVGVTSDRSYNSSNYFEALYPFPARITAGGLDDASFLEEIYPGLKFVHADALNLPFEDGSFDFVHSSAVLEHVGSFQNQVRMIEECLRVARRGICLTTPNRWFPIEFHTQLPIVHWLPVAMSRRIFRALGHDFFAKEENLNLMSRSSLRQALSDTDDWKFDIVSPRLLGWPSNLMLFGTRV